MKRFWHRLKWKMREIFCGRPMTKYDHFKEHVRLFMIHMLYLDPYTIKNFTIPDIFDGHEDMKGKVCLLCFKLTDKDLINLQRNSCGDSDKKFTCTCIEESPK